MLPSPSTFQTLLVPLDGSHMAEVVLPTVEHMARRFGARVMLYGRIAQQVLQHCTRPVLALPPRVGPYTIPYAFRRILTLLDGTPAHEPALALALGLVITLGGQLHLALVIPTVATLSGVRAATALLLPGTMRAILDLAEQGAQNYLRRVTDECRALGIDVSAEVVRGDPVAPVLDMAERLTVDLIIMASQGRAGLEALLAGSVAPRLVSHAHCPLLLVHV